MFYDRFIQLCDEKGVKPTNACIEAGLSRGLAAKWKSTKANKPSADVLEKLSAYFEKSIDSILGNEQKEKPSLDLGEPIGDITGIPIIASVKAGYDGLAVEDDTGEFVQIPSVMLRGHSASNCRAMHIRGDSMYPNMKDGDIVVVHIQQEVENGKVAVCIVNGDEGTIKRFFRYPDRVELWPDNPNVPKMILRGEQLESFHLYGQAIALIREDL